MHRIWVQFIRYKYFRFIHERFVYFLFRYNLKSNSENMAEGYVFKDFTLKMWVQLMCTRKNDVSGCSSINLYLITNTFLRVWRLISLFFQAEDDMNKVNYAEVDFSHIPATNNTSCSKTDEVVYSTPLVHTSPSNLTTDASPPLYSAVKKQY